MEKSQLSDFTRIKKLGEGTFGRAYLARRNLDGVEVCLKEIPLKKGVCSEETEREAKMLSELNHEHVIKCFGSFIELGNCYIIMEYAAEGSLADMIAVYYCSIYILINLYVRSGEH